MNGQRHRGLRQVISRLTRAVTISAVLGSSAVFAADEPPETADPSSSCVDAGCHATLVDRPHLHWADVTQPGQCQRCHEQDGDLHDFETKDEGEDCLDCHEELGRKLETAELVHEPAEEDCLDCHDPHAGKVKALLLDVEDENLKGLCFTCHETEILKQEYGHGPAKLGACNECHEPHATNRDHLLVASGLELCGGCHEELLELIENAEHIHDPADEDCVDCHNPHSGPFPNMLFADKRQLCAECHEEIVKTAEHAAVGHDPTTSEDECLSCHTPHASDHAPILKLPQRELCLDCHDRPVASGDDMLIDMAARLRDNEHWHEPVTKDDCSGCHRPHGSKNFRLLKKPFPAGFYAEFNAGGYGLCFSCHESVLATVESSRKVTRFRDGDRNLHFLHVNKERRGRSCRACHAVHASNEPLHIRERVPYGRWLMPINFQKTESGGSCQPGCHDRVTYDRNQTNASKPD